jgi:hypothetical protein
MSEIGDTLKARGRPTIKLVGVSEGRWTAETVTTFSAPFVLSDEQADAYKAGRPAVVSEADLVQEHLERVTASEYARAQLGRGRAPKQKQAPGFTPEQAFAAAEAEYEPAARGVARAILADEAKLAAVEAGHVGVHPAVVIELRRLRDGLAD